MFLFSRRAESIIETLIAVTVIVLTTAAGLSLVRNSFRANTFSRNELVAAHLAEEAAAALIHLRDSNYLRFPASADLCWDHFDLTQVSDCNLSTHQIRTGIPYYLTRRFSSAPLGAWDLSPTSPIYPGTLNLYTLEVNGDLVPYYADAHSVTSAFTLVEEDLFTRQVRVTEKTSESYTAVISVSWEENDLVHSYTKTQTILHIY